mgnify:CR=1 FL=1
MIRIKKNNNNKINVEKLENFTREIFKNKRKQISNVLPIKKIKNKEKIKDLNILHLRAEDLTIQEIIEIFNEYSQI